MTTHFSVHKIQNMTKAQLQEQVKSLIKENNELKHQLQQSDRSRVELLAAIRLSCQKHRAEKDRLQRMYYMLKVAKFLVATISVALVIHADILGILEHGVPRLGISKKDVASLFEWFPADHVGGVLVAVPRFATAIPSQVTFPAPWRSFSAAFLFAIYQMVILFLPKWCIGLLGLFATGTIFTLDWDRNRQVSASTIRFKMCSLICTRYLD
jgi:hypothetical protein